MVGMAYRGMLLTLCKEAFSKIRISYVKKLNEDTSY